jgi:hypothetical protein
VILKWGIYDFCEVTAENIGGFVSGASFSERRDQFWVVYFHGIRVDDDSTFFSFRYARRGVF